MANTTFCLTKNILKESVNDNKYVLVLFAYLLNKSRHSATMCQMLF